MAVHVIVVAAILGNWWTESYINPGAWQGYVVGGPGYGLGQWTDITTSQGSVYRRTALFNYLSTHGYQQDDGNGQLEFFEYENYWTSGTGQYSSLFLNLQDFLSYIPTGSQLPELETLTYAFQQGWEGIRTIQTIRYSYAQNCLDFLIQHGTDPRKPWYKQNSPLALNESYSNCLLVYDYLNGVIPPPPTPTVLTNYMKAIFGKRRIRKEQDDDIAKRKRTILF